MSGLTRRELLRFVAGIGIGFAMQRVAWALSQPPVLRAIPSSGEKIPAIGVGSWQTFDVIDETDLRNVVAVLNVFFRRGGRLVDSSPMYGDSEAVIGTALQRLNAYHSLFSATKVWTPGKLFGQQQMVRSADQWGIKAFDLMQIHNMLDWETHYESLVEMKAKGKIRYMGITTSHGRRHEPLEKALANKTFDFVQLTYNIIDRDVEKRLLPLARERGIAVIVNRPFQGGDLFDRVRGKKLPPWASEIQCATWSQFYLKYILGHPAVTCVIPATSKVSHMEQNMGALYGAVPDKAMRIKMQEYIAAI